MDQKNNYYTHRSEEDKAYAKNFFLTCFVLTLILISFGFGYYKGEKKQQNLDAPSMDNVMILNKDHKEDVIDFTLFWSAWDTLKEKYVATDELDPNELLYGAIDGMLGATGDPYTTFFDPEENKEFNDDISGSFEGIGAEIGIREKVLTIISPLKESPAERAGLLPGDKILKIDGQSTADMTLNESVKLIRGPKDTEVKFVIFRNNEVEEKLDIVVKRDVITVDSVTFNFRDDGIAVIEINRFGETTSVEFKKVVQEIKEKDIKGVVLDVRNNPGGYLGTAVELASHMLTWGSVVVIEEDGDGKQSHLKSRGDGALRELDTVVLINEGSASASEIVAGALRDNRDNVKIVGKKSFGKGSVQELVDLEMETALKVTVAKWLTPNGDQINDVGIEPDEEVKITREDYENDRDPQLDRALEIIQEMTQ